MVTRRRYPSELRERALRLARDGGRPLPELAAELGVHQATLRGWVRADQAAQARHALVGAELLRPLRLREEVSLDPAQLAPGKPVHIGDLEDARGKPAHLYGLEYLWWGDYTGDAVARSNHRSLLRDFGAHMVPLRDAAGHDGLAVLPSSLSNQRLASALLGLGDYPLYDEADHSALVAELAEEAWDRYVRDDVEVMLARRHGIDCYDPDLDIGEQRLRELFTACHRRYNDHFAENAVTVVYPSLERVVAEVAAALRHELQLPDPREPPPDPAAHRGSAFGHSLAAGRGTVRPVSPPGSPPAGRGHGPGR